MKTTSLLLLASAIGGMAKTYPRSKDIPYKVIPIYYPYGDSQKTMASLIFGTSNETAIPVVMDLGSTDFWVWEHNSTVNYGSKYAGEGLCNITSHYYYDPFYSRTATPVQNFSAVYAYGGNSKILTAHASTNDSISVPRAKNKHESLENVQIALVDFGIIRQYVGENVCPAIDYDYSILGLSPKTSTTQGPSVRENLLQQGYINRRVQSMWMVSNASTKANFQGASLLGAVDTSKFSGKMAVLSTTGETGYVVKKPSMSVKGVKFTTDASVNCLLDSGSLAVTLPIPYGSEVKSNFFKATGFIEDNGSIVYPAPCSQIPPSKTLDFTFTANDNKTDVTIKIPYTNFARGTSLFSGNRSECALSISTGGSCVYGAPFFTSAFFAADDDKNVVGLAQGGVLKGDELVNNGSLIQEIRTGIVGTGVVGE